MINNTKDFKQLPKLWTKQLIINTKQVVNNRVIITISYK
jgi:hypothetical protein